MHARVIRTRMKNEGRVELEIDSMTNPSLLAIALIGQFTKVEKSDGSYLRASAMEHSCPRAIVLSQIYKRIQKRVIDTASMITFDIGNSMHRTLQT